MGERLRLLVTPISFLWTTGHFTLIRCHMASVHLPWFLDGQFARLPYWLPGHTMEHMLILDGRCDPILVSRSDKRYAKSREDQGLFGRKTVADGALTDISRRVHRAPGPQRPVPALLPYYQLPVQQSPWGPAVTIGTHHTTVTVPHATPLFILTVLSVPCIHRSWTVDEVDQTWLQGRIRPLRNPGKVR